MAQTTAGHKHRGKMMRKRIPALLATLMLCAIPMLAQQNLGPPDPTRRTIRYGWGEVYGQLGAVATGASDIGTRKQVRLGGVPVTHHTFTWATEGNATIGITIESSTDCVNWDSVTTSTTESDSHSFEGGFCDVAITVTAISAGRTLLGYRGVSSASAKADGTGTNNELALWTDAYSLEGDSDLTFDGTTLVLTGAATVSTTLGVTGNVTLAGDVIMSTGKDIQFINSNTQITGTSSTIGFDVAGASKIDINSGEFVINDGQADYDTRIESDGNANAFVLDAGAGTISLGLPTTITGNFNPAADSTYNFGTTSVRWANVWSDLVNGADYSYVNGWRSFELELYEGYGSGIAFSRHSTFRDGLAVFNNINFLDRQTPDFAISKEFIEIGGRRLTVEMLDQLIKLLQATNEQLAILN